MKKTFWDSQDTILLGGFFLASFDHQKNLPIKDLFEKGRSEAELDDMLLITMIENVRELCQQKCACVVRKVCKFFFIWNCY